MVGAGRFHLEIRRPQTGGIIIISQGSTRREREQAHGERGGARARFPRTSQKSTLQILGAGGYEAALFGHRIEVWVKLPPPIPLRTTHDVMVEALGRSVYGALRALHEVAELDVLEKLLEDIDIIHEVELSGREHGQTSSRSQREPDGDCTLQLVQEEEESQSPKSWSTARKRDEANRYFFSFQNGTVSSQEGS